MRSHAPPLAGDAAAALRTAPSPPAFLCSRAPRARRRGRAQPVRSRGSEALSRTRPTYARWSTAAGAAYVTRTSARAARSSARAALLGQGALRGSGRRGGAVQPAFSVLRRRRSEPENLRVTCEKHDVAVHQTECYGIGGELRRGRWLCRRCEATRVRARAGANRTTADSFFLNEDASCGRRRSRPPGLNGPHDAGSPGHLLAGARPPGVLLTVFLNFSASCSRRCWGADPARARALSSGTRRCSPAAGPASRGCGQR